METGLSVLLPISNAQLVLEATVSEILDVLPDRGGPFELCLVDDGSTDETTELAHELAARYPQVTVIRNPARLGLAAAIWKALVRTRAEHILVAADVYGLEPDDLRTLWQLRELERRQGPGDGARGARCETWISKWPGLQAGTARGFQLIRRATFEQFRATHEASRRVDIAALPPAPASARPNFLRSTKRAPHDRSR